MPESFERGAIVAFDEPLPAGLAADELGTKGRSLRLLTELGLRVPRGIELSRAAVHGLTSFEALVPSIEAAFARWGAHALGDVDQPLVVSVRSSGVRSLPGLLTTITNVGVTRDAIPALTLRLGSEAAAWDTLRRQLRSFARALGSLEEPPVRASRRPPPPTDPESLKAMVEALERTLPADVRTPTAQLALALTLVKQSWLRALEQDASLPRDGISIIVEEMAFGNAVAPSGAGIAFSHQPVTGAAGLFGEFAAGEQGDEVSGGRASPAPLRTRAEDRRAKETLATIAPAAYTELESAVAAIEARYGEPVEVEFTVEQGTLQLLQARPAVLSARAKVRRVADALAAIDADPSLDGAARSDAHGRALARLDLEAVRELSRFVLDDAGLVPIGQGLVASMGAAIGTLVVEAPEAVARTARGEAVVLARPDASPDDAPGVRAAVATFTSSGGLTSHAAVMSRALHKPCVVSVSEARVERDGVYVGTRRITTGTEVSVDGTRGLVFEGRGRLAVELVSPEAESVLAHSAAVSRVPVLTTDADPEGFDGVFDPAAPPTIGAGFVGSLLERSVPPETAFLAVPRAERAIAQLVAAVLAARAAAHR